MCRIIKIFYACGHRDDANAPCEWRDEGRINILGKRVPCEKSIHNCTDLSRGCMACSQNPARQNLIEIDPPNPGHGVESYISYDQEKVMATIVKNESHLRMRAKISRLPLVPAMSSSFPTSSEIHYQCHVNEEFLARRFKRRQLQRHFERRGAYQDFLDAAQDHLDAKNSLCNSIFSLPNPSEPPGIIANGQRSDLRTNRIPTVDRSTQTDNTEEAIADLGQSLSYLWSESDSSSRTITISLPQVGSSTSSTTLSQSDGSPIIHRPWSSSDLGLSSLEGSFDSGESSAQHIRQRNHGIRVGIDLDEEERFFILSREADEQGSSRFLQIETGGGQEQESEGHHQFSEFSDFVFEFSDAYEDRGISRQDSPPEKFELDSLEGIAKLADIRLFLGMKPDTKPIDMWNFANRNEDLLENITGNVLPIRPKNIGKATREGFKRDAGIRLLSDFADEKWELSKGFVETWNSLNWTFEALSESESDDQHSEMTENSVGNPDSKVDELNPTLNVEDILRNDVDLNTINSEYFVQQDEILQLEDKENKPFSLLGRHVRVSYEVGCSGRLKAPSHQARNASRLRTSWTYANEENVVSSLNLPKERDSVVYLQPPSTPLQDEPVSLLPLPRAIPISQDLWASPLSQSSVLASALHDDTIPHLSLENRLPEVETEESAPWSSSQGEPQSQDVSGENNPSYPSSASSASSPRGSISPHVFSRKKPPILLPASSTRGQKLLSYLRQFLAMPKSATPQDISSYIDRHPGLMEAIRDRRVPTGEALWEEALRKSREKHTVNREVPRKLLKASTDRAQRAMQATMVMALQMLDWEEIDAEPVLFTPASAPWEDGWTVPEDERDNGDDDDEEECDFWVRSTVSPDPGRREGLSRLGLARYQIERPSPLRTTLTRRDVDAKVDADVDLEQAVPTIVTMGSDISPGEQENWDDVDSKDVESSSSAAK